MSSEVTPEKRAASSHSSSDYDAEKAKTSAGKTNVNPVNFNDGINRDLPIVRKVRTPLAIAPHSAHTVRCSSGRPSNGLTASVSRLEVRVAVV